MRSRLILAHQPAEADYIRVQNGSEFSLPRAGLEDLGHQSSDDQPNIAGSTHRQAFDPILGNAQYTPVR
jgi:hypothetical protein